MARKLEPKRRILNIDTHCGPDEPVLLKPIKGITPNHRKYLRAIENSRITFCTGPAGTGKTYMAVGLAARLLAQGDINRIIITRPLVVCGDEELGFLPGELNDKVGPYMLPIMESFEDFFSAKDIAMLVASKIIEMRPLALMRGSNIRDAFIICDEAQNAKYVQLRMFLTRFARGSRVVVTGDITQTDLKHHGKNPLAEVLDRFRVDCRPEISIVRLDRSDTQRDPLTAWVDERLGDEVQFHQEWQNEPWRPEDAPTMSGRPEDKSGPVRFDSCVDIDSDDFGYGLRY